MSEQLDRVGRRTAAFWLLAGLLLTGCRTIAPHPEFCKIPDWQPTMAPAELNKVIQPMYVIEPPDILSVDAVHVVPKQPYRLRTLDSVLVQVLNALPEAPIDGEFQIEAGGTIRLGYRYGSVKIAGLTVPEAEKAIQEHLQELLREPRVSVSLGQIIGKQQIAGEHMVGPDGTITLGTYGSVLVVGLTVADAKAAIERHLSQFLEEPEVSVSVFSYNSKVYYVVTQGAGLGDQVARFPMMGNETVLDAVSNIQGLTSVSSDRMWIARPGKGPDGCDQILPVDWLGITQRGDVATNYQLMPGDRLYIGEDKWIAFDNSIARLTAPIERVMGFSLLGVGTVSRFSGKVLAGGGTRGSFGFGAF